MLLPTDNNLEFYVEPQLDGLSNGQDVPVLQDYSGKGRSLSAAPGYPTFQTPAVNGRAAVIWDGTKQPLKNSSSFTVWCGFMVIKIGEAAFSNYAGILTDTSSFPILVGGSGTTNFYDNIQDAYYYEFRSLDRIYSRNFSTKILTAPAPMNSWSLIFFRYWTPVAVNGIQIGQDRTYSSRKAKASVALLALYSRNFYETDIRNYSQILATAFGLTLADVYPYQADKNSPENPVQSVNFYDPPEGDRISEVLGNPKRILDLQFSSRRTAEKDTMLGFHAAYYAPALDCLYRDYKHIPPRDVEGYIDSQYKLTGAVNNYNYSFTFKEK